MCHSNCKKSYVTLIIHIAKWQSLCPAPCNDFRAAGRPQHNTALVDIIAWYDISYNICCLYQLFYCYIVWYIFIDCGVGNSWVCCNNSKKFAGTEYWRRTRDHLPALFSLGSSNELRLPCRDFSIDCRIIYFSNAIRDILMWIEINNM